MRNILILLSGTSSLIDLTRPISGIKWEFLIVQEKITYEELTKYGEEGKEKEGQIWGIERRGNQ